MEISCEGRIATFIGDIKELLSKYSSCFEKIKENITGSEKYILAKENYTIIFTYFPVKDSSNNLMIAVAGKDEEQNKKIMDSLGQRLGLELRVLSKPINLTDEVGKAIDGLLEKKP